MSRTGRPGAAPGPALWSKRHLCRFLRELWCCFIRGLYYRNYRTIYYTYRILMTNIETFKQYAYRIISSTIKLSNTDDKGTQCVPSLVISREGLLKGCSFWRLQLLVIQGQFVSAFWILCSLKTLKNKTFGLSLKKIFI